MDQFRFCVYHGSEWMCIVEQGWVTHSIELLSDGTRLAVMIYVPRDRR